MKNLCKKFNGKYPFELYDEKGNKVYVEQDQHFWYIQEFNKRGKVIYYEDSAGERISYGYDKDGNLESTKHEFEPIILKKGDEIWQEMFEGEVDEYPLLDEEYDNEPIELDLNSILDKISEKGMDSLTGEEKEFLKQQK